jgi:hypothetical protein
MLLFSNKMYENFSTTDALNAVASTEKKVNEMVSTVDGSHVRFPKKIVLDKGLAMGSLKMAPGNWLDYGIEVPANKKLGIHAPGAASMELHVDGKINGHQINGHDINGNRFCIDGVCINKTHLEMLTGKRHHFISNYKKNRFMKQEGDEHAWKLEFKPDWADEKKRLFFHNINGEIPY